MTSTPSERAPATVVISLRPRADRLDEYRRWQDEVNRAAATFEGFVGSEVVPPVNGSGEWTVVYRFATTPQLQTWLGSAEREELLRRGADLFEGTASQQVLVGEPEEDLVTVVVTHPVDPAREDEFLAWQVQMNEAERSFPGFRGSELFRPVAGVQDEWTTLFRFDTEEHLNAWLDSAERKRLLDEGQQFKEFELRRISSPFGSWFAWKDIDAPPPPQWKTALSVLVGLYPLVVLLTLAISEAWPHGKLWETLLLGNVLSVAILTWIVMPFIVTRALRFWLAPRYPSARVDAIGAAVSIVFLVLAALFFWLITTQIWTLP
jgi:antibiotic biosynthesis monooxygenase (ABM) superfamily enzyme